MSARRWQAVAADVVEHPALAELQRGLRYRGYHRLASLVTVAVEHMRQAMANALSDAFEAGRAHAHDEAAERMS